MSKNKLELDIDGEPVGDYYVKDFGWGLCPRCNDQPAEFVAHCLSFGPKAINARGCLCCLSCYTECGGRAALSHKNG